MLGSTTRTEIPLQDFETLIDVFFPFLFQKDKQYIFDCASSPSTAEIFPVPKHTILPTNL